MAPWNKFASRLLDIGASAIGLFLLTPLFAVVALRIWRQDGGPVFFSQIRVGKDGKLFRIWKFRTMSNGAAGSRITAAGDRRVTTVGNWLRKYKVDELPQLINVLLGEMSLIGPRPEVPEFVNPANPAWRTVLSVRPGITDLASLIHRDEESLLGKHQDPETYYREILLPSKLRLNAEHLASRNLARDLILLALTVRHSFFPGKIDGNHLRRTLVGERGQS